MLTALLAAALGLRGGRGQSPDGTFAWFGARPWNGRAMEAVIADRVA